MSLSTKIRQQLLESFRAELAEHIQTITDGMLALEQGKLTGETRQSRLDEIFRAAHSLKGAARAVGVIAIEQVAHALENVLDGLRGERLVVSPTLFNAVYESLDAIQVTQATYEGGATTPPPQALEALSKLDALHSPSQPKPSKARKVPKKPVESAPERSAPKSTSSEVATNGNVSAVVESPSADISHSVPGNSGSGTGISQGSDETIRVSVSKLDALMEQLSELMVTKLHAKQRLLQIDDLQERLASWQKDWLLARSAYNRLLRQELTSYVSPTDANYANISMKHRNGTSKNGKAHTRQEKDTQQLLRFTGKSQEQLRQMNSLANNLARQYANDTMQLSLVIDELEQEIKRVRMLPLNTITASFRRMVRDLAKETGKEAVLQIEGGETELDKRVLEQIKDPLIHILRNAVEHGIETPEERRAAGKPSVGTITLSAEQLGQDIVIRILDDGIGVELEAVRRAIAKKGHPEVETLSDYELTEALFNPGISTSPIITEVSGRGVGLDVVRRNVEALQGRVEVNWNPGKGTTFTLGLPLTMTSSRGLLVRVADELFVIPFNAIVRILSINPSEVFTLEGKDAISVDERPVMVAWLADVLELPRRKLDYDQKDIPVVVVATAERHIAFAVDELAGEQEVVIKSLGWQLSRLGGIAGATLMGDGQVVLILNVSDLIKLAIRGTRRSVFESLAEAEATTSARARRRILVVDDSITTRTLEKNILEAAGYLIDLANDGQEAWEAIQANGKPDLIVSDIAMPRLNGFDLTRRVKEGTQTADIPVILVTSLDSAEDKARGIEAGADAYIIKSRFDQNTLLETIEQLI